MNARQILFPYGMSRNKDGSWTFVNRLYKTCGTNTKRYVEWDDPEHRIYLKGLTAAVMRRLSVDSRFEGVMKDTAFIHFYDDDTIPEASAENMRAYMVKLQILIGLDFDWELESKVNSIKS